MAEAITLGDRLGVLEEGRLIACDRPDGMLRSRDERVRRLLAASSLRVEDPALIPEP
jgi:ABC-type proline/glycine betaine transport system ATPase subunit